MPARQLSLQAGKCQQTRHLAETGPSNIPEPASCPPGAGTFANTSAASPFASAWAGAPDALMYATANGSRIGALLAMSQPAFDVAAGKLTFAVRVLPADAAALALAGGATARVRCQQRECAACASKPQAVGC